MGKNTKQNTKSSPMKEFNNIAKPNPALIQNISIKKFKANSCNLRTDATMRWNFSEVTKKDYYLVRFSNKPPIFMIDANNLYVDGFMWKREGIYSCICCTGTNVIRHTYDNVKININRISKICNSLEIYTSTSTRNYKEIENNLDIIAFLVSESIRFNAIHEYLVQNSAKDVSVSDFKDLVTSWGQCQYNKRLHIPKGETKKILAKHIEKDKSWNCFYQWLSSGEDKE